MKTKNKKSISGKAWGMIAFLFTLTVISNADKAIIGFASVKLMDEFQLTPEQWGIVGSSFFLLYSISAIVIGGLADKIGTKKVIAIMALVWAVVQFSSIYMTGFVFLLITRIILGAGEGPAYSLAMTAASKWLPKERLGIGLTLVSVGGPLGVAVSAPILISIINQFGWRAAFLATAIVGVIWVILWVFLTKEAPESDSAQVKQADSAIAEDSSKFTSALLSKNFLIVAGCGFATYWVFTIGLNWVPNYFENVRNVDANLLGIIVALPWVLITISQITWSMISDRRYAKTQDVVKSRIYILGPVLVLGALCFFVGTIIDNLVFNIAFFSLGLSFGVITLVMGPAILMDLVSRKHQGKIQGWFMAISSLGGIVGPYVTGRIVQSAATPIAGFHSAFQLCGLFLIVFGLIVLFGVRPKKKVEKIQQQEYSA